MEKSFPPGSDLLGQARQFSDLAFEFRRMSAQIDNAPFPVIEDESFESWDFEESDEEESEDVDEETTSLASALGAQAECLDYIAERILSVSFSGASQTKDALLGISLDRLTSILEETLESVLEEATRIKDNLEKTVQNFCDGMTLEDSEAIDGVYEMAIEAFEGEADRMEKVKELVDKAIDDLLEAFEEAE